MTMPSTNPSIYLRSLILLFVAMASFRSQGQVTGNTNVNANSTHTYQLNKGVVYPFPNWIISGGTEQSSWNVGTTYYVSAKWDGATSNGTVVFTSTGDFLYVTIASVAPPKPNNPTITSNGCGQATLQRSGNPPSGVTWYWQGKNSSGTSTSKGSGSTFTANEGTGTYYIRARNSSGQWSSSSGSRYVSMVNLTGGSIATSGNQVVCYNGNPVALNNETSAGGISGSYSYQWQRSSNGSSGWSNVSGATSASYDPPSGQTQSWYYRRRVTCGAQTQYSANTVLVSVHPDLNAGAISGAHTICYNGNPNNLTNSSSAANGDGSYVYQWQYSNNGSSGWTNISGATSTSYNPPSGLTSSRWYRRRVISCGQTKYTSSVKVTVQAPLASGGISGAHTICYNGDPNNISSTSSASNGVGGYVYQWQYSNNGSSGWTNISGATSTSYNPPSGLTSSRWYRRRVISCGQTKYTGSVKVTVRSALSAGSISGAHTICSGENPSNLPSASSASNGDGSYAYQWQYSNNGSSGWTNIGGATSTSYDPPSGLTADRWYRRRVISCGQTKYTGSVKVTVTSPPVFYADTDKDGFGDPGNTTSACSQPTGYVSNSSDHDDTTPLITNLSPQTWYSDVDGDGFGASGPTISASFKPLGYADNTSDQCPEVSGSINGCDYIAPTLSNENRIYTRTYQTAMTSATGIEKNTDVLENVVYFDDLGRPQQQIAVRASGTATRAASPNTPAEWTMDWSVGTGGTPFFNRNGTENENERFYGPNPFGETDLIWRCGNEPDNSSDGGWNTDEINIDKTKTYRYMVWVRRDGSQDGTTYHGTKYVNNLDGSANDNPYFWSGDLPQLGQWYLLVGIVHPYTHGSTDTGVSGVYDINGNQVIDRYEYKWKSDTTSSYFRSYFFYSTDVNTRQYFYKPILEIVDGNEIPLQEMFEQGKAEDIVTHMDYDQFGRQDREWLPYHEPSGNPGSYRGDVSTATKQYYLDNFADDFPGLSVANVNAYSQKGLEASPLNRVLEQGAPGKGWKLGEGHEMGFEYSYNTFDPGNPTNPSNDNVRLYRVDLSLANNTHTPTLVSSGHYGPGELYKNIVRDENWTAGNNHTTEEYVDKQGRVVLKRAYANIDLNDDGDTLDSGETAVHHDTYYVYDTFGNLTYVLPPKVVHDASISATELSELCYQYVYDGLNRLVEKKIPGKGWEYIVYNKLDQSVLTQDANLRANNQWLFTKYDAFGRVAYTGIINNANDRDYMVTVMEGASDEYVTRTSSPTSIGGTDVYYTNDAEPVNIDEIYTVNYYDSYVDTDGLSVPAIVLGQSTASGNALKGLSTVSKTRILGTSDWTITITGYDLKNRPIYTASRNDYLNITDVVETQLDFAGRPEQTVSSHTKDGSAAIVTTDVFGYDHMGRLLKQEQTIGGNTETLAENHYDGIGQLIAKGVGGGLQHVDYGYNVRGWLTSINNPQSLGNDLFAFKINYNNPTNFGANEDPTPLFNGNISQLQWNTVSTNGTANPVSYRYSFGYDALNRITEATDNTGNYNLYDMTYDPNGNIMSLKRKGNINSDATSFGTMDNLTYHYGNGEVSNQLLRVRDWTTNAEGFKDSASPTSDDYTYDDNGNMLTDANKGITAIAYNHLNLPTSVTMGEGTISYIYDAAGTKLKKTAGSSVTEYANGYVYSGTNSSTALQFFNHPEGYVYKDGSVYKYVYQYKDHLGNIRLSYEDGNDNGSVNQSEIVEENNYYPFGLKHHGYNSGTSSLGNSVANRWKFGGKELDDSFSGALETYDFGARNYNPDLGRWMNVDPLADKYYEWAPFNYTMNNPILFIDPDGKKVKPNFESKANLEKYNSVISSLRKSSFFSSVYKDLDDDYDVFNVTDFSSNDIQRHPTARGKFTSAPISTFLTKDNNFIKFNTSLNESPINKAVVAEEFFHAAQSEFGDNFGGDLSATEAEAKVGVAFLVYQGLSAEQRGDLNSVAKAFNDFGASDITARSLVYRDRRGAQLNTKITKYFDAIISGSEITPKLEENFRAAVKQYSGILSRSGYSGPLGDGDGSYNGETPILDMYLTNQ